MRTTAFVSALLGYVNFIDTNYPSALACLGLTMLIVFRKLINSRRAPEGRRESRVCGAVASVSTAVMVYQHLNADYQEIFWIALAVFVYSMARYLQLVHHQLQLAYYRKTGKIWSE